MSKAIIEQALTELRILTPYSAPFVTALKQTVPYADRSWSKPAWIVTVVHLPTVLRLCRMHFGDVEVKLIDRGVKSSLALNSAAGQVVLVEYVGACKQRDDGKSTAYGWWNGGWNVIFPEEVLRGYFEGEQPKSNGSIDADKRNQKSLTLYQVLTVDQKAAGETIKSAYKRLARIWHPDINHEEDAAERFRALKRAYDILGNPDLRRRYDAGLQLEASLATNQRKPEWEPDSTFYQQFYRAPLTCGKVEVRGQTRLGRIQVERIEGWWDVVNVQGKTMVSSWDRELKEFRVEWVADFQVEV